MVDIGNFVWIKEVPIKVKCFVWREKMGRILTALAISRCIINLSSTVCCQCGETEETTDHVLVRCLFAKEVLEWIFRWCYIPVADARLVHNVLDCASHWRNFHKKKKRL